MRNIIKLFLSLVVVVLCILIIQKIQFTDTTTDTTDYWYEEMTIQYLFYINKK